MKYYQNNVEIKKRYKDLEKETHKNYNPDKVLKSTLVEQKFLLKQADKIYKRIANCNNLIMSGVQGPRYKNARLKKDKLYQELRPIVSGLETIEHILNISKN